MAEPDNDTEVPAFEIRFVGAPEHTIKIYASGKPVTGVSSGYVIVNRIPMLIAQAEERAEARVRRGLLALCVMTSTFTTIAIFVIVAMRWLGVSIQ